ncbi:putative secreted protein [Clostridioides difficile CD201]|nr:putative secreted protein [Clostridioides difficile CD201]
MRTYWIYKQAKQSIVCIPNRVSIKINTNEKNDNQEDIISK